jgi:Ser/Thr protein kinase RdoA (MazF antagonist)
LGQFGAFKPVAEGTVQTNFILQTTTGKFIFRYYENRSQGSVAFESHLVKYLNDKNYPCPAIFNNNRGEYVGIYKDKPFIIFEFVEGEHLENPTEAQKRQLIAKVAELQNITQNYHPLHKEDRWNYSLELAQALAQREASRINTANSREKLAWFETELSQIDLPESLPKGICHCDFHFSNILFKNGQFRALIDFDDANFTFLTYDLATLINPFIPAFEWNTWSSFSKDAHLFDFREAGKIVEEYVRYRPLAEIEKKHLFDVYKLTVMFDCIWYFERGDVNDFYERRKIDGLNRLGRANFYAELF